MLDDTSPRRHEEMQSSTCKGNVPHNSRVCRVLGTLLKSVNPSKSPATVRPLPTDEDYRTVAVGVTNWPD
jgi:hypothetical protein